MPPAYIRLNRIIGVEPKRCQCARVEFTARKRMLEVAPKLHKNSAFLVKFFYAKNYTNKNKKPLISSGNKTRRNTRRGVSKKMMICCISRVEQGGNVQTNVGNMFFWKESVIPTKAQMI